MDYQQTIDFLYASLPVFQREGASAYKPGLENTAAFNALLGHPDRRFRAIHVAGTNGKGSTSHMLAAVLQAAGYRTGLFTSPHLKDFRERVRVDGRMIPEREVVGFVERHHTEMVARGLTFFEMCTLLAFDHFARSGVEVAVVETGLGGRLDATNIITPILSIITNIGLDHTDLLGDTLQDVAREKAGIIKPGIPVLVGAHDAAVDGVFADKAASVGAPLRFACDMFPASHVRALAAGQAVRVAPPDAPAFELELDLPGEYQRFNVPAVLAACNLLGETLHISQANIADGLRNVQKTTGLRGRWQILSHDPPMVCDTGHNAHGIREVVAQLGRQRYETLYFILGVVADKDLDAMLPLLPAGARYIFTQPSTPRARSCASLAEAAARYGLQGRTAATVPEAIAIAREQAAPHDMIFIGGSTFTVADIPADMLFGDIVDQ